MDPEQKRSLQDIMPPARRRPMRPRIDEGTTSAMTTDPRPRRPSGGKSKMLIVVAVVVVLIAALSVYGLSSFFESATVTIIPREQTVQASDLIIEGEKDAQAPAFAYTIATTEKIGVRTVPATGSSDVSESARGKIIIYNNHSATPQKLIKNTRFETPEGLVYRTPNSISVPGKTTKDGKSVPGSLEIEVVAYEAGEKYNIGLTDFTIPGLKGDERFETLYARSKTPMTGGFVGKKAVVDKAVEEKNRTEMRAALEQGLKEAARAAIPAGFFAPDSLIFTSYTTEPSKTVEGGAELREKGTAYAILLPYGALAQKVAASLVGAYNNEAVSFESPEQLQITLDEKIKEPWAESKLSFTLNGPAKLIWVVPMDEIKTELTGKAKDALEPILNAFPSVESADVVITPVWNSSFPSDPARITITGPKAPEGQ